MTHGLHKRKVCIHCVLCHWRASRWTLPGVGSWQWRAAGSLCKNATYIKWMSAIPNNLEDAEAWGDSHWDNPRCGHKGSLLPSRLSHKERHTLKCWGFVYYCCSGNWTKGLCKSSTGLLAQPSSYFTFYCLVLFFWDRVSLCVDQAGLKLTEICLPLLFSAGIKGVCHHIWFYVVLRMEKLGPPAW